MEFRISKGWRIAAVILGAVFSIGGLLLIILPLIYLPGQDKSAYSAELIPGLLFIAMGVGAAFDTLRTKLSIRDGMVGVQRGFGQRSLAIKEIAGYRTLKENVTLFPINPSDKKISLPKYLEGGDTLTSEFLSSLQDLDARDYQEEEAAILSDETAGASVEERGERLKAAKKIAQGGNIAAVLLMLWAFLKPEPYEWLLWVLALSPVAGVYITWRFKGVMILNPGEKSTYPSVGTLMSLPALGLFLRALLDYDLYKYQDILVPVAMVAAIGFAGFAITCRQALNREKNRAAVYACVAIVLLAYAFGLVVTTNGYYDRSRAERWNVSVEKKSVTTGKHTTYYLQVSPWGRFSTDQEESVSHSLYDNTQVGDKMEVILKKGLWGIPWYYLEHP